MQVSFKRHLKGSYMIVEEMEEPKERYELMMLLDNKICGLLPLQVFQKEKHMEYWYDITGKQSLTSYLEREKIRSDVLLGIVYGLKDLCMELTNYFLEENRISLHEDFIYLNFDTKQLSFVYLPFQNGNIYTEFQTLMELIIRKMDHSDKEAVEMGYELYQSAQKIGVGLYELLEQINFKKNDMERITEQYQDLEEVDRNDNLQKNSGKQKIEDVPYADKSKKNSFLNGGLKDNICKFISEKKKIFLKKSVRKTGTKKVNASQIDETKYINKEEYYKTSEQSKVIPIDTTKARLIYQGSFEREDILIDKDLFLIGNSLETSHGFIFHKSISRLHARIERMDNAFYLEDLNSENGTYINGKVLDYREKVKINADDIITFGTQSFRFIK